MSNNQQTMLHTADTISLAAIIGALAGLLPPLAALFAILWYCIQIYESKTYQCWRVKRRRLRHIKHHRKSRDDGA